MLTEEEGMARFDQMLDECYEPVKIAWGEYYPSVILKECDPIAYRVAFSEYADSLAEDGEPVEGYV